MRHKNRAPRHTPAPRSQTRIRELTEGKQVLLEEHAQFVSKVHNAAPRAGIVLFGIVGSLVVLALKPEDLIVNRTVTMALLLAAGWGTGHLVAYVSTACYQMQMEKLIKNADRMIAAEQQVLAHPQ